MDKLLKTDEAVGLLGIEPARFRFLEVQCQDFLSSSRLEFPRCYSHRDIRIIGVANLLLKEGITPASLRLHIAQRLASPAGWNGRANGAEGADMNSARLIAVASGKGGVGKSSISLNLGVETARSGLRTVVLDGDLGVANLHLMAGLRISRTLRHVISGECGLEEIIIGVPGGPDIVPGSSGIFELANLREHKRQMLLSELRKLEAAYDVIIIDTAAGVAAAVIDFVVSSDFAIVVTTPEATAITDAYALIKLSIERDSYCRIGLLANRVKSGRQGASALGRISQCARRFLGRHVLELGCVWEDSNVRRAVNDRAPFTIRYPQSRASMSIQKLARMLREKGVISTTPPARASGFGTFVDRHIKTAAEAVN